MLPGITCVAYDELLVNIFLVKEFLHPGLCSVGSVVTSSTFLYVLLFLATFSFLIWNYCPQYFSSACCEWDDVFSGYSEAADLWRLFLTYGSETWVCVILLGSCASLEGFIFWFTKSFALRNEVSMLCHLVSVLGCEVYTSRWMLCARLLALGAHAGRVQGREMDFDGFLFYEEASCLLGSSSIQFFVLSFCFCFLIIFSLSKCLYIIFVWNFII